MFDIMLNKVTVVILNIFIILNPFYDTIYGWQKLPFSVYSVSNYLSIK